MSDITATQAGASAQPSVKGHDIGYLYGPFIDFLCLGGGSLLILFPIAMMTPEAMRPLVVLFFVIMANFVNNPHFMHSYQIFYDGFHEKAFGDSRPLPLRIRYVIAGIAVPVVMCAFFAYSILTGDPWLVGFGTNVMLFLVGWHYVKQGYGILIVESVLKRSFFNDTEKLLFRYNGFAVWLFSWTYGNIYLQESELHGLKYYSLQLPGELAYIFGAVMAATTLAVIAIILRRALREGARLPINGLLAYAASGYVWLIAAGIDKLLVLMVPAFHSLQYLAVVWRYQLNKENAGTEPDARGITLFSGALQLSRPMLRLLRFILIGTVVGVFAFWLVPIALSATIPYDRELFGAALFVFIAVIFINIHHYFLDNVMWRKENPDIKRHLFTPK